MKLVINPHLHPIHLQENLPSPSSPNASNEERSGSEKESDYEVEGDASENEPRSHEKSEALSDQKKEIRDEAKDMDFYDEKEVSDEESNNHIENDEEFNQTLVAGNPKPS